jgi:hypothetical protein
MAHQRPDVSGFDMVHGWRCPLCTGTGYSQVEVARSDGKRYLTEFYECLKCTVMFRHPGRFARLGIPLRRWAGDIEPRSLSEAHGFFVVPKEEPSN